jgi:hypothetical protein
MEGTEEDYSPQRTQRTQRKIDEADPDRYLGPGAMPERNSLPRCIRGEIVHTGKIEAFFSVISVPSVVSLSRSVTPCPRERETASDLLTTIDDLLT